MRAYVFTIYKDGVKQTMLTIRAESLKDARKYAEIKYPKEDGYEIVY